jgi:hypothetical protein
VFPSGAQQDTNGLESLAIERQRRPVEDLTAICSRLFELNQNLELSSDVTKDRLLAAMRGHILAEVRLMAIYQR